MEAFLIWERIVLESLAKRPKTEKELIDDTSIKKNILSKITKGLLEKNIIMQKEHKYFLSNTTLNYQVAEEVKDIFSTLVNTY